MQKNKLKNVNQNMIGKNPKFFKMFIVPPRQPRPQLDLHEL